MQANKTALVLIGYQNDYFAEDGILHSVIEESSQATGALGNTLDLLRTTGQKLALAVSTPIIFTEDYSELADPVGILKTIKEVGAFKQGTGGADVLPELSEFDFLKQVPGKRGLNAFSNTELDEILSAKGVENIVLAGAMTSICIDSTGRAASEKGYKVTVLSDCTTGRTTFEQDFYCEQVFPLYASVTTKDEFVSALSGS